MNITPIVTNAEAQFNPLRDTPLQSSINALTVGQCFDVTGETPADITRVRNRVSRRNTAEIKAGSDIRVSVRKMSDTTVRVVAYAKPTTDTPDITPTESVEAAS